MGSGCSRLVSRNRYASGKTLLSRGRIRDGKILPRAREGGIAVGVQPARNLSERDLRSLDLKEFLTLVQEDIKELDNLRRKRPRPEKEERPASDKRRGRQQAEPSEPEPEDEPVMDLSLHLVSCCGKRLGGFPAMARVRCPFCERWHRAGDFPPETGNTEENEESPGS